MFSDRKKAQGEIITTVLIILLVLAIVVIVWQVVRGTVEKGAEEIEAKSECIGLDLSVESATCGNTTSVVVKRGGDSIDSDVVRVLATDNLGVSQSTDGAVVALGTSTVIVTADTSTATDTTVTVALVLEGDALCEGETEIFTCAVA